MQILIALKASFLHKNARKSLTAGALSQTPLVHTVINRLFKRSGRDFLFSSNLYFLTIPVHDVIDLFNCTKIPVLTTKCINIVGDWPDPILGPFSKIFKLLWLNDKESEFSPNSTSWLRRHGTIW